MPGIDQSLPFHPLGMAVLTISDTRTAETDTSGALLVTRIKRHLIFDAEQELSHAQAVPGRLHSLASQPSSAASSAPRDGLVQPYYNGCAGESLEYGQDMR